MMLYVIGGLAAIMLLLRPKLPDGHKIFRWSELVQQFHYDSSVPIMFVYGMIYQESSGDPSAVGGVGEKGLMQLTRGAVLDANTRHQFDDMFDPEANIETGCAYLRWIESYLDTENITLNHPKFQAIIMCYNAGVGNYASGNYSAGLEYFNHVAGRVEELRKDIKVDV